MKKVMYLIMVMLLLGSACTRGIEQSQSSKGADVHPEEERENSPIGKWDYEINPEQTELFFGLKNDTIIVHTGKEFGNMEIDVQEVRNSTWDTVRWDWVKLIAMDPQFSYFPDDPGKLKSMTSKKLKVIVFDNDTGAKRDKTISLGFGDAFAHIDIEQEGE